MKIQWHSNAPYAATGYGNQTKLFAPRIRDMLGHDLAITAFYGLEGARLTWNGIQVYPKGHEAWGNDVGAAHTRHYGGNVLITLMDAWVVNPDMMQLQGVRWIPWFPVDMEPLPPPVARNIRRAYRRIVFSRYAETAVHDAGMDCYYVPHGVDTKQFKPMNRTEVRENLGWPQDKFIVGMVAANKGTPSRKALPDNITAFAELHKRHPDTMLYLHCNKSEHGEHSGVNLPELCQYLGLEVGEDVIFAEPYQLMLGYSDEYMAAVYSGMDVFLLASMGEGFGIPIIEAQACGTPVIVGDWTAMGELCLSGWKIPKDCADAWWTPLAAYQYKPRVGAIVDALLASYDKASGMRELAEKKARLYDADRVTKKYWKPVLDEIEQAVGEWHK